MGTELVVELSQPPGDIAAFTVNPNFARAGKDTVNPMKTLIILP